MKNTKKHLKFITNIKLQEAVNHLDASEYWPNLKSMTFAKKQ